MAESKYPEGLPQPALAHEMWSWEICKRLDEIVRLLKAQTSTLVGDRAKGVQVEITEPDDSGSKAEDKSPAKTAPASAAKPAPAKTAPAAPRATAPAARASTPTAKK